MGAPLFVNDINIPSRNTRTTNKYNKNVGLDEGVWIRYVV